MDGLSSLHPLPMKLSFHMFHLLIVFRLYFPYLGKIFITF